MIGGKNKFEISQRFTNLKMTLSGKVLLALTSLLQLQFISANSAVLLYLGDTLIAESFAFRCVLIAPRDTRSETSIPRPHSEPCVARLKLALQ